MTTSSFEAKAVQLIIKKLKTVSNVTKYVDSRVYGSYISTIQDFVLPAISIHILPSAGQAIDEAEMQILDLQIDLWFPNYGANASVWDDVMECFEAAKNELHNNGGWDDAVGINVIMIENISRGPQLYESDTKVLHYTSKFRVRGTLQ